jgi:hypothetical protein
MSVSTQELICTKTPPGTAQALAGISGLDELPSCGNKSGGNKDVEDFYNRFGWKDRLPSMKHMRVAGGTQ